MESRPDVPVPANAPSPGGPPSPSTDPTAEGSPPPPAIAIPQGPWPPHPPRRQAWRMAAALTALFLVAVMSGGGLFAAGFALGSQRASTAGTAADLQREFEPFWEAWNAITTQYVGEVDRHALIEGAIGGLFRAVDDPYSGYMSSEEYKRSLEGVSGRFEGIGAEIGTQATDGSGSCSPISATCRMVVIAPLEGSPAEGAGLKAGDVVLAIDGSSTDGLTLDEAVSKIRGQRGTDVTLTLERSGVDDPIELTITRDVIVVKDVSSKLLEGGTVGYLRVSHFSSNAGRDLRAALQELLDQDVTSLVLDLRDDPGGFVPEAVAVASEFLPEGTTVFWEEYADGREVETTASEGGLATDPSIRLVVLTSRGTASASEIVAAALKEQGRATVVGETTFGKGTVQEWQLLSQDAGGFRLTIAKWLTPMKVWVNGTGIEPDIPVSAEGAPEGSDPVLAAALEALKAAA